MSVGVASADLPDFLGETVDNGRLKLIERLGSGAFGVVYKALDTSSSIDNPIYYAVKCMKKEAVGSREAVFQVRELKLQKMVSGHPNILTAHKNFSDGKHIFVVLDYCAGFDLFVQIREKRRFHRNTALIKQAYLQILDAVEYCHAKKVFHRDLKPENILLSASAENLFLADFGLATQSGISNDFNLGSSHYMAPESISQDQYGTYSSRHSDIWALGVILTNLISGRNPWNKAEIEDECYRSFLQNPDTLLFWLPISKGANDLLKQCFRIHPLARPSIAKIREIVLELDTFFLTDEELLHASSAQRAIAKYYSTPTPESAFSPDGTTLCDEPETDVSSLDPDEVYLYDNPPFASPDGLLDPNVPFPGDSSSISPSDISSVSGVESSGPITPASQPVEPVVDVEVPELPEDQNIGDLTMDFGACIFQSIGPK
ncbi:serine/threonine protein kinase, negative regulator of sexual conjugation and meiosis [Mycena metata]|uniref:Serine/threonine protein kinase, negative regulator of sexual conjugation and meiosis n=1 Tax=Mycena metata TaxID=1033252 RepID=A0AAD7K9F7_9AGAR|nr:serine/threonine protein kinase, negative regulator of sexual conjugation and meiosis [Mycena metata]